MLGNAADLALAVTPDMYGSYVVAPALIPYREGAEGYMELAGQQHAGHPLKCLYTIQRQDAPVKTRPF